MPSQAAAPVTGRASRAVIPAAGLATRFLPATKTVPKELFPLVDRPVLDYIVAEAVNAGLRNVLLVTGRGKTSMVDYFDRRPDLEARLAEKEDDARLAAVRRPADLADIYTCRQQEIRGLGHAVAYAEAHVGEEPFAVLLGDEFCEEARPLLPAMIDLQARTGGIVIGLVEVPDSDVDRYGIASVAPAGGPAADPGTPAADPGTPAADPDVTVTITGLVEKPARGQAPSNLAVFGRYVLPSGIFDAIRRTGPGRGGEIQLTDAMSLMLAEGTPVHGVVYRGRRYDTGVPLGYLQTVVRLACERPDVGDEFRGWLAEFVGEQRG
jgi:UTP--glucose-1-phosphate uridylyltransferase